MMLGLAAGMSSRYFIRSNREAGDGRFDLVLEPKFPSLPGIIFEFKAEKVESNLMSAAEKALKQIDEKRYDTELKSRGITEIVKYGIAFSGKEGRNSNICIICWVIKTETSQEVSHQKTTRIHSHCDY